MKIQDLLKISTPLTFLIILFLPKRTDSLIIFLIVLLGITQAIALWKYLKS